MLVRAIRHEYAPGRWARCTFDGDAFELEDQRNNSDASFKTYSRSNMMPRPYCSRRRADPAVGRACAGAEAGVHAPPARGPDGRSASRSGGRSSSDRYRGQRQRHCAYDARRASAMLAAMRPRHLHLALDANAADSTGRRWPGCSTSRARRCGRRLAPRHRACPTGSRPACVTRCAASASPPKALPSFRPSSDAIDAARKAFPRARIGGGTPHFFVQLNRAERLGAVDFLTFTTSPIVHGTDDESVMASPRLRSVDARDTGGALSRRAGSRRPLHASRRATARSAASRTRTARGGSRSRGAIRAAAGIVRRRLAAGLRRAARDDEASRRVR